MNGGTKRQCDRTLRLVRGGVQTTTKTRAGCTKRQRSSNWHEAQREKAGASFLCKLGLFPQRRVTLPSTHRSRKCVRTWQRLRLPFPRWRIQTSPPYRSARARTWSPFEHRTPAFRRRLRRLSQRNFNKRQTLRNTNPQFSSHLDATVRPDVLEQPPKLGVSDRATHVVDARAQLDS